MKSVTPQRVGIFALLSAASFAIAFASHASATLSGTIDTYVGGGDGDGDLAINATIDPRGIALTGDVAAPNMYVADAMNNRVRRIDGSTGIITTIAGNGTAGFAGDGGQGQNASLNFPLDVAVDSAGNVFIADMVNNRVRKVAADGHISTLAGTGQPTYNGEGLAAQAALSQPYGVAIGPDGNVYIADLGNSRVRKVSPPGCTPATCVISTVAGSTYGLGGDGGPATQALLCKPADVAFDGAGNMYIADSYCGRIRRVAPNGTISTVAGGGTLSGRSSDGGPGTQAVLWDPYQVAADSNGNVYIADTQDRLIRMLSAGTYIISTVAGTGSGGAAVDGGPATAAALWDTWGVAATTAGTFWLSQSVEQPISRQNRVRKVVSFGVIQSVVGGGLGDGGAATNALVDPRGGDAVSTGGVLPDYYFADGNNNVVRRVDGNTGIIHSIAGTGVAGYSGDGGLATSAKLQLPIDVAVDTTNNLVYIADMLNNVVRKIDRNGVISTVAGTGQHSYTGEGVATQEALASPRGVDVDQFGNLYIADRDNMRVRKVSGGQITTVVGNGSQGDSSDPAGAALRGPTDVAVASDGTLYIADSSGNRIRRLALGIVTNYAGTGTGGFSGDTGLATLAKLSAPSYLALDGGGNLFIADTQNNRVRRVDALGLTIDTVAGNGGSSAAGDSGPATAASIGPPSGVAIDPAASTLFIAANTTASARIVEFGGALPTPTFTATPLPPTPTNASSPTRTPTSIPATATRTNTPGPSSVSLLGHVAYYANSQVNVSGVQVTLNGPADQTVATDTTGNYSATMLAGGTWDVTPGKSGGFGNAVSSLDAARVLQVVAGLTSFTPQQQLACDVTGDGTLSALDAVRILQFSAGVITKFPAAQACGGSDWLFYPSPAQIPGQSIVLPTVSGGVCQQGNIVLSGLNSSASNQNFNAILFGDCTGNWTASAGAAMHLSARSAAAASATTVVRAGALRRLPGHRVRLPIYVQGEAALQAFDVRVGYDASALTFTSAAPHGAAAEALIGINSGQLGVIGVSLASAKPINSGKGAVLMLEFGRAGKTAGSGAQLLGAQVDEHPASVVNHSPR